MTRVASFVSFVFVILVLIFWVLHGDPANITSDITKLHTKQAQLEAMIEKMHMDLKTRVEKMHTDLKAYATSPATPSGNIAATPSGNIAATPSGNIAFEFPALPARPPTPPGTFVNNCYASDLQLQFVKRQFEFQGIMRSAAGFAANIIAVAQHHAGVQGPVGEIGVFMGKFTTMILMSTKHDELENGFFHADAFESLGHFNPEALSGGQGSQRVFHANLNTWAPGALEKVNSYIGDTRKMRGKHITINGAEPKFRLISIDGDHAHVATLIDICLLSTRLAPGGVIAMDDFGNPDWKGVVTAWREYVQDETACDKYGEPGAGNRLEPFAIIGNKIFLTTVSDPGATRNWTKHYGNALLNAHPGFTERYGLKWRSGLVGERLGIIGEVSTLFNKRDRSGSCTIVTDLLALNGEALSAKQGGGEPPSFEDPANLVHLDPECVKQHAEWLNQGDNLCATKKSDPATKLGS